MRQAFEQKIPIVGANRRTIEVLFVFLKESSGNVCFIIGGGKEMNIFRENDVVVLREGVEAKIIDGGDVFMPEGAEGTIVIVYVHAEQPSAYEVEFFISKQNDFALATVDAGLLCKA